MATMTKTSDAVTKAMAKAEAAELAFNAASQAVIDAERAMVLAKEARYTAQREAAAAAAELEKAKAFERGDAILAATRVDFSKAKSSYSGAAGRCCCGCAGNHSETPVAIKRQVNRIKRLAAEGVELDIQPSYVAAEKDGRLYIVYLAE